MTDTVEHWTPDDIILRCPLRRLEGVAQNEMSLEYCKGILFRKGYKYLNLHRPADGWMVLEGMTGVHADYAPRT